MSQSYTKTEYYERASLSCKARASLGGAYHAGEVGEGDAPQADCTLIGRFSHGIGRSVRRRPYDRRGAPKRGRSGHGVARC
jgi:hypothetical protein